MKKITLAMLMAIMLLLAACNTADVVTDAVEEAAETAGEVVEEAADAVEETVEEVMADELECSDALGCVEVDAGDPIVIAYMLPTSGPVAFLGEDQRGGVEIAIDDRGGELLGHEIELTGEDSLCSAEGGQSAAQKVAADDSIAGIIGTACSSAATAALPIISEAGLSMISSSNTAPTLTDADQSAGGVWQPGYYRTAHNDLFQGRVAAEFAYNELGARRIATIHDGSPYADGLQAVMAEVFIELGGEVTFQGAVNVGDTDMRPILTEIASDAPDLLYFPIFEPEAPLLVAQSTEIADLETTILFGADAALVDSFPENAGAPAEGMYLSGPYVVPEGAYGDLLAKWDAKFGGAPPSGFHGHAYDGANMLMDAIEAVAQSDADGNLIIGRQAIRDYLSNISGYAGTIGQLSCNDTGDCATGEALGVYEITDAEISGGNWPPAVIYTPGAGVIEAAAAAMDDGEMMSEFDTNITVWADDTRAPILNELVDAFQAEYGVGLIIEEVADINDQFPIAAPAGEGPDVLILAHDRIGGFYASGLLAPIDLGGRESEFYTEAINAFTYEGDLVGMPYAVENLGFFYNADMVAEAPATWDEAIGLGAAMVDAGDATYAIAFTGTTYDMFPLQTAFGGYVFGRGDAGYDASDVGIDSAGMIAAGDFVGSNIEAGYISNSTDWDTAHLQFETGEIPFLMAGPWALDRIRESGVNYAIAEFPDGGQSFLGVQGFAVNALSDNVLLAQAFLTEFVATVDVMTALAESGNRPSAHRSVVSDDADLAAFNIVGENALPMPAIPEMGSVWGSWGDAFTLIMNGEQGAEEALTNGAAQIRDLIGGAADGMVNVPGSWQSAAGFDCEWAPDCADTALTDNGDGTYSGTFDIPAGDYEGKVALDGAWTENYGVDGKADGDNYAFTIAADGPVTFTFDSETKLLTIDG